jgi:SAM-dependent methyltransferase
MALVNIKQVHENWTALGNEDPMWVVLTDPSKKGNKWDKDDFFATGRHQVKAALEKLQELGVRLDFHRALDFGCGVGRLSQALGEYFGHVDGVDVSASMIEHARALNQHPEKVSYHLNVKEDLSDFPSHAYDFIFSVISLQHVPPRFQKKYIAEFVRLLKPQGTALFQTIHSHGWRSLVPHAAADAYRKMRSKGKAFIPLYGIPPKHVYRAAEGSGGVIVKHESSPYHGHQSRYVSDQYIVTKQGPVPMAK